MCPKGTLTTRLDPVLLYHFVSCSRSVNCHKFIVLYELGIKIWQSDQGPSCAVFSKIDEKN